VLIFSDPEDVAAEGQDNVYPDSFWLPGNGIARGSIILDNGDPETPTWPSLPNAYRVDFDDLPDTVVPKIVAQPISYNDAREIFLLMDASIEAPKHFVGGLDVPYVIGGTFGANCLNCKAVLESHNVLHDRYVSNVLGFIKGEVEPDRYVIMGNHRDAWGYGAVDPNSGTAQVRVDS